MDTESLFSEKLFYDTVQILSRLNTREDFVVSVNLVTRFSNRKAVDFIRMFNTRYHTQYSLDGNARETIMKNL
ncbi:MAG: hypothetical protein H6767_03275 [Candidatus Peribacteria bacterium]|nr:MAG: hypothetical protein H6767_03275 [Candidatus Peribacteria bacterium]